MAKSVCHIVPGVQPQNLPSPKLGEQDRTPVSPPVFRPVPPDEVERKMEQPAAAPPPSPPAEQNPRPRAKRRKSSAGEQISGVQHEIRAQVRRQKQPSQKRPPSARAVHIYERAVIQEVPQRQVAQEFGITQSAVSRKCAKVIAWMGRCGAQELRGMNDAERGRYVVRYAERKYDFYREQAEAAHLRSLQDQVILVETGSREAAGTPGVFGGAVTIRKTVRPQSGKPSYLREARLAVDSLVLLDWGCIGKRQLTLVPDPDEVARKEQEELCKRTLERNRRLEWELERAQEEIANLKQEAAMNWGENRDRETTATDSSPGVGMQQSINSGAESRGRESSAADMNGSGGIPDAKDGGHQSAPSEGLSSRAGEADGLAFLEEVKQVITTLDRSNHCDAMYHETLTRLYEISRSNHRHHGIVPERQTLPTLRGVRKGLPYFIIVPARLSTGPKEFDEKEYFRKYCGIR